MKRALFLLFIPLLGACDTTPAPPEDKAPPSIVLGIPTTYHDPSVVDISVSASDDVGVTLLTLSRADDGKTFRLLKKATTEPFAFVYSDKLSTSGEYTYRAVAEDASGKVRTTDQVVTVTLN